MNEMRSIRGEGTLVTAEANGSVIHWVLTERLLTSALPRFGGAYQFVENNNMHSTGRRLRGLLILCGRRIGVIIEASATAAVFRSLLPPKEKEYVVDLWGAIALQQIGGPPLTETFQRLGPRIDERGYIFMNPNGPDTKHVITSNVSELQMKLIGLHGQKSPISQQVSLRGGRKERTRKERPLAFVPTLYVLNRKDRRLEMNTRQLYAISFGSKLNLRSIER